MAETSMVEKVARVLTEAQMRTANELYKISAPRRVRTEEQIAEAVERGWRMNEQDARAAVEAMREPTEAMMEAYLSAFISENRFDGRKVYGAMIDAALNGKEG